MADTPEKRRKKQPKTEQDENAKPKKPKSNDTKEEVEVVQEKKPKKPKRAEEPVEEEEPPRKKKPKKPKPELEEEEVLIDIPTEETPLNGADRDADKENGVSPKKPKKKKKKVESEDEIEEKPQPKKPKGKSLKQSRRWDQEDLEVIEVEEEVSDEQAHSGKEDKSAHQVLDVEQVLALSDEEKVGIDYLTRVMPDEILRKIYSHLEPITIDQTATVCKRTNELLQERSIWKVYQPEWTYVTKEKFNKAHSRSAYAGLYNYEMNERRKAQERKEAAEYAQYLADTSEWAKGFMTLLLFNRSIDYLSLLSFILGTCFAAARCQETILWNWRLVLLPFYIPMLQLVLTPLAYDLSRWHFTSANVDEVTDSRIALWHISFATHRPYRGLIYLTNLALMIFWILLMVKLNDNLDGIPAGPLIIPWLLLLICIVLEQFTGWASGSDMSDGHWVDRVYVLIASVIMALLLLFVVFKLDAVITWSWYLVLIPLWVLFGFTLLFPFFSLMVASCSYSCRHSIRIVDAEDVGFGFGALFFCTLGISAPLFTWFILGELNLDGLAHRSWPVIFIPIFIMEALVIIGCGLVDFIYWLDH